MTPTRRSEHIQETRVAYMNPYIEANYKFVVHRLVLENNNSEVGKNQIQLETHIEEIINTSSRCRQVNL